MDKGDLSAPTCNNCHGNHGAVPPQVGSVANACGTCHGKIAKLFSRDADEAQVRGRWASPAAPPATATTRSCRPTDAMLGMGGDAVCVKCHASGKYGATMAGAEAAKASRGHRQADRRHRQAQATLDQAERLGMEVSQPKFELRGAFDALTNARSLIHSFQPNRWRRRWPKGRRSSSTVQEKADHALQEHTYRRIWLAASLGRIFLVIVLLLFYIRSLPPPTDAEGNEDERDCVIQLD